MHNLKVTIDPARCVGYGRCATVSEGVFQIDAELGKAFFEQHDIDEAAPKTIFAAARACPTQAIMVEQLGRRLYPQILEPMPSEIARQLREAAQAAEAVEDE
jgi:ferredoxin